MHHDHDHPHTHEHTHADGSVHAHEHVHQGDHAHPHPHTHEHTHADGSVHAHEHVHEGDHAHSHGCGGRDHIHCGEHINCAGCGHDHDPKAELMALMRYMVGHNSQHANELAGLAKKLDDMGDQAAYEQVMQAVSDFEKGNLRLSTVLASLER